MKSNSRQTSLSTPSMQGVQSKKRLTSSNSMYCSTKNKLLCGSAATITSGQALVTTPPSGQQLQGTSLTLLQKGTASQASFNTSIQKSKLQNSLLIELSAKRLKSDHLSISNYNIPKSSLCEADVLTKKHTLYSSSYLSRTSTASSDNDAPVAKRTKFQITSDKQYQESISDQEENCYPKYDFNWPEIHKPSESYFYAPGDYLDSRTKTVLFQKQAKKSLVNAVCLSLIRGPSLKDPEDAFRRELLNLCGTVKKFDPEFILKVALYTRQELNIRSTTNLLLAFVAFDPSCRPYLKRYFNKCVVLPSDWIDVADQYQFFEDKSLKSGSLPAVLRKCLATKFQSFDVYRLAKYNKGKSKKKASKKQHDKVMHDNDDENEENEEEIQRRTFTLKKLIRLLHLKDPAEYVMGLIGKRYPENEEKFRESRLNGIWDETKAGHRMKLPVPITWETQLSLKGNNKKTWEELIDGKKLPYMAMLRNLRNIILAGVSRKHHTAVVNYITNKDAIIKSRQFPHQFAAAEEVLKGLESSMYEEILPTKKTMRQIPSKVLAKKMAMKKKARAMRKQVPRDLFRTYEKALKKAIGITTFFNISPIPGKSIILLDIGYYMYEVCSTARGLGNSRTVLDMAHMLTKLCTKSSEMSMVYEFYQLEGSCCTRENPFSSPMLLSSIDDTVFTQLIRDKEIINNLIVFTSTSQHNIISHFVSKYRLCVSPNLLYVTVCLSLNAHQQPAENLDENDVCLYGFTDSVLRFIAERGKSGQVGYIERIDEKYNLAPLPKSALATTCRSDLNIPPSVKNAIQPNWQIVKVFISSTFLDMHGERDLLIKYIFPELRNRAGQLGIDVREVDLRWGITDDQSNIDKSLVVCLSEVAKCHLFIGILGDRYGFVPKSVEIPVENSDLAWVNNYPAGASITELEFHAAALSHPDEAKDTAFFFIRDSSGYDIVPKRILKDFIEENEENCIKLHQLKTRVCHSGLEVFNQYPCKWGGIVSGKPLMVGLEEFGQRVLNNLWSALLKIHDRKNNAKHQSSDFEADESVPHAVFAAKHNENFVGRKTLVDSCMQKISSTLQGMVLIVGRPGSGKTTLMAHVLHKLNESVGEQFPVVYFFVGATFFSGSSQLILHYLASQIKKWFKFFSDSHLNQSDPSEHLKALLAEGVKISERIFILIDGLDMIDKQQQREILEHLNLKWPKGVTVIFSAIHNGPVYRIFHLNEPVHIISIGSLSLPDRMQVIRKCLSAHSKFLDEATFNNQLQILALKQDSTQPLFISLACEELRTFGVFEKLTEKIRTLNSTVEGLLQDILERLEEDFGLQLVSGALGLLTVCDEGLLEDDLYALLSVYILHHNHISNMQDVTRIAFSSGEMIPRALYSKLLLSLQCLLQQTDRLCEGVLKFSYVNVITAVRLRYHKSVLSVSEERLLHCIIAGYFWKLADPLNDGSWNASAPRALLALTHHLLAASCFNELEEMLCNLNFIRSKVEAGLIEHLLDDYHLVCVLFSMSKPGASRLATSLNNIQQFQSFIVRNLNSLKLAPKLIIQQALNEPEESVVSRNAQVVYAQSCQSLPPLVKCTNKLISHENCQLTLHYSKPVLCAAMSPDEVYIAIGEGNSVHLYNLIMVKKLATFTGHDREITCLLFIGNNKLCSASGDGSLSLWNVDQKHRMYVLKKHKRHVSSCCCDPAGHTIVSVSWDGSIILWKVNSGEEESLIDCVDKWSPINCVAFHPLKQLIVTGGWDCSLKLWCLLQMKCIGIFHGHTASISSVSVSPDGRTIISTSLDATFKLWSTKKGIQLSSITNGFPFTSACFSASGSYIFAGSTDKTIKIFGSSFGEKVAVVKAMNRVAVTSVMLYAEFVICGYEDGTIQATDFLHSSRKHCLACGNSAVTCLSSLQFKCYITAGMKDGAMKMINDNFDVEKSLFGHTSAITSMAWSSDFLLSGSENGCLAIYKRPFKNKCQDIVADHVLHVHIGAVTSISFKANYKFFATSGDDRLVKIWTASTFLTSHSDDFHESLEPNFVLRNWHMSTITACCWVTADGMSLLITAGNDLLVCGWDIIKNEKVWEEKKLNAPVVFLMSVNQKIIIGGSLDGTLHIWGYNGVKINSVAGDSQIFFAAYFDSKRTHDMWSEMVEQECQKKKHLSTTKSLQSLANELKNILVARTSPGGEIDIFKPGLDKVKEVISGHSDSVTGLGVGVGQKIVSSSLDGNVKIWSPKSILGVREHLSSICHWAEVVCLAYDMTVNAILSGDRVGNMIVWRRVVDKWQAVHSSKAHEKAVTALCTFTNFETWIVSASNDCSVKLWKYHIITLKHHQKSELSLLKDGIPRDEFSPENIIVCLEATYNLTFPATSCVFSSLTNTLIVGVTEHIVYSLQLVLNKAVGKWKLERGAEMMCLGSDSLLRIPEKSGIKNWIMHLQLINLNLNESIAFIIDSLGTIGHWRLIGSDYEKKNYAEIASIVKTRAIKFDGKNCQKQAWPTAFHVIRESFEGKNVHVFKHFIGLGSGELMTYTLTTQKEDQFELSDLHFTQVHSGAVNGLACLKLSSDGPYIISTGGDDGIVRIWEFKSNNYKQVGHFNCKSQVKCLLITQDVADISNIHITCGDALGNVYFLNVKL